MLPRKVVEFIIDKDGEACFMEIGITLAFMCLASCIWWASAISANQVLMEALFACKIDTCIRVRLSVCTQRISWSTWLSHYITFVDVATDKVSCLVATA